MIGTVRPHLDYFSPVQRSMRINGMSTCLRLEKIYWHILAELGRQRRVPLSAILSEWDTQAAAHYDSIKNFSGFVRVMCVAHVVLDQVRDEGGEFCIAAFHDGGGGSDEAARP